MESLRHNYKPQFYEKLRTHGSNFAEIIIPMLCKKKKIKTVLDVGCGNGSFLLKCLELGCRVRGFDGRHVIKNLLIPANRFTVKNLQNKFEIKNKYDLVVTLEVAEHLDKKYKDNFIDSLCMAGDMILFSAAQVGQPGIHHVNCQPLEYWINEFSKRGFIFDIETTGYMRLIEIHGWYRRNAMLFYRV